MLHYGHCGAPNSELLKLQLKSGHRIETKSTVFALALECLSWKAPATC